MYRKFEQIIILQNLKIFVSDFTRPEWKMKECPVDIIYRVFFYFTTMLTHSSGLSQSMIRRLARQKIHVQHAIAAVDGGSSIQKTCG